MREHKTVTIARLDLTGCPIGTVLDPRDSDKTIEQNFFSDWVNALTPHPYWGQDGRFRLTTDSGRIVLEHIDKSERCLLTGEDFWRDYMIEADIRQLLPTSVPNADDEHNTIGRSGIVFRCQTLRRYYFFCLEGYDRIVLYRREDDCWVSLAHRFQPIDRSRYYMLKVEICGERIRCYMDSEVIFEVCDDEIKTGKCGFRTNTLSRVGSIKVTMTSEAYRFFVQTRDKQEKQLAELRQQNPKPVLYRRLEITDFYPCAFKFGYLRSVRSSHLEAGLKQTPDESGYYEPGCCEPMDILLIHAAPASKAATDKETKGQLVGFKTDGVGDRISGRQRCMTAMTLDGEVFWQRFSEHEFRFPKVWDMDGDGCEEVACINGENIVIVSGSDGEIVCEEPLPPAGPYVGFRGSRCNPAMLYIANLRGLSLPSDIVIMDGTSAGGHTIWAYAYDAQKRMLSLLWTRTIDQPPFGHHLHFFDVDGDGKEEVLAGCFLLDEDGSLLWQMEDSEYFECFHGGRHPDVVAIGEFDGDETNGYEAVLACGSEGVFFVDAKTGKVRRHHRIGHAQGLSIGNFRTDLSGLEVLVGTRWGNYGILTFFSGSGDKLFQFQPDYVSQGGPPVNWRGDGQEFVFLFSTASVVGLYDAYGRKVVELPEEVRRDYYAQTSPIVQDIVGDKRDELIFAVDGALFIYTQDEPFKDERIYAPTRERRLEYPVVSKPRFVQVR